MSVDVSLYISGRVDPEEVRRLLEQASERPAVLREGYRDEDMSYFEVDFAHPFDRRKSRMIRFHSSDKPDKANGDLVGDGSYTMFSMGAFDRAEEIMKLLGERFGGVLENEATNEIIRFDRPERATESEVFGPRP